MAGAVSRRQREKARAIIHNIAFKPEYLFGKHVHLWPSVAVLGLFRVRLGMPTRIVPGWEVKRRSRGVANSAEPTVHLLCAGMDLINKTDVVHVFLGFFYVCLPLFQP